MDPLETSLRGRVADTITRGSVMGYQAMGSVRNTVGLTLRKNIYHKVL